MRTARWKHALLGCGLCVATGCAGVRPQSRLGARTVDHDAVKLVHAGRSESRPDSVEVAEAKSGRGRADGIRPVSFQDEPTRAPDEPKPSVAPPAPEEPDIPQILASGQPVTLSMLEAWAMEWNPAIRQASASAMKSMGFRYQVGRYPNPTVGYSGQQLFDAGTDQHMGFVTQDIIMGGKLALNEQVLAHSVQSQLWEVEAQRFRVLTDVRTQFYDAVAAQQRLDAATDFREVLVKGVRVAEARKEAQEGSQPEVLLARIQKNEIELTQRRSRIAWDAAWKELAATTGLRQLQSTRLENPPAPSTEPRDWNATYADLVERSPELRAANARVCRAAANVRRQEVQPIPNLELQVAVGHDLATNSQLGQVQAGLPIPIFNNNQGNIDAARAEYSRAVHEVERLKMSIGDRLARAARAFDSARATVEQYENQILPQSQESLKLSEQAYAAGEFGFLEVLTSRRIYFQANMELIDARRDLSQANATIEGLLLNGGLDQTVDTPDDDGLRGQTLSGQ